MTVASRGPFTFVGRQEELELLQATLSKTLNRGGGLMLIAGEAGVGKSRLVEEFVHYAILADCLVSVGHCLSGQSGPASPFGETLGEIEEGARSRDLRVMASSASPQEIRLTDPYAVLEELSSYAALLPVVVVLEDLHWGDSNTIKVLHHVARNIRSSRILVVGTYRPEEILPKDESGAEHPLLEALTSMRKERVCSEIELKTLGLDEVRSLVENSLGGTADHRLVNEVASQSEGLPLYVVEEMQLLIECGWVSLEGGTYRLDRGAAAIMPSSSSDIITHRINRMAVPLRMLLEEASVLGPKPQIDLLATITKRLPSDVIEGFRSIADTYRMMRPAKGFEFTHQIIQRVAYARLDEGRRKELHLLAGETLEPRARTLADLTLLANHFASSGEASRSLRYSLQAGEGWLKVGAIYDALPLLQLAASMAAGDASKKEQHLRALEGLGDCDQSMGNFRSAVERYEQALLICVINADRGRLLRKCAECWSPTRLGRGDQSHALELLDRPDYYLGPEEVEMGEIQSVRSVHALWNGDFDEANKYSEKAENIFCKNGCLERLADQMSSRCWGHISMGEVDAVLALAPRIADIYEEAGCRTGKKDVGNILGMAHFHRGNAEEAMANFRDAVGIAEETGEFVTLCWGNIYMGMIKLSLEDAYQAVAYARLANSHARDTESPYMIAMSDALLGISLAQVGKLEEAAKICEEASNIASSSNWRMRTVVRGMVTASQGALKQVVGDLEAAAASYQQALVELEGCMEGLVYKAMVGEWLGRVLMEAGHCQKAEEALESAFSIYYQLENQRQQTRMRTAYPIKG